MKKDDFVATNLLYIANNFELYKDDVINFLSLYSEHKDAEAVRDIIGEEKLNLPSAESKNLKAEVMLAKQHYQSISQHTMPMLSKLYRTNTKEEAEPYLEEATICDIGITNAFNDVIKYSPTAKKEAKSTREK